MDGDYVPPEEAVIGVLKLFVPSYADNIEEEAWSICIGDEETRDNEAIRIRNKVLRDVTWFLSRYESQLKDIASKDELLVLNNLKGVDFGDLFQSNEVTVEYLDCK